MWAERAAEKVSVVPKILRHEWAVKDSNLRSLLTTDLQSVPFGHLGNCPYIRFLCVDTLFMEVINIPCRADDENRTRNRPLTRRVLCRLSYVGEWEEHPHLRSASPGPRHPFKQDDYTKA